MSSDAIVRFLDDFRRLHAPKSKSRLISMKVPEPLLAAFKLRCQVEGTRYQTQIKTLMLAWLEKESP
jgi:predicted DNA binding CopG/RHH family protein